MTVYAVCVLLSVLLHHRESETAKRIRSLIWYGSESLSFLRIVPNYNRVGIHTHTHTHTQYIRLLFIHGRKKFDSDNFFVFCFLGCDLWQKKATSQLRVCTNRGNREREREGKKKKKLVSTALQNSGGLKQDFTHLLVRSFSILGNNLKVTR